MTKKYIYVKADSILLPAFLNVLFIRANLFKMHNTYKYIPAILHKPIRNRYCAINKLFNHI